MGKLTGHGADLGVGGSLHCRRDIDKVLLVELDGRLDLSIIPLGLGDVSAARRPIRHDSSCAETSQRSRRQTGPRGQRHSARRAQSAGCNVAGHDGQFAGSCMDEEASSKSEQEWTGRERKGNFEWRRRCELRVKNLSFAARHRG